MKNQLDFDNLRQLTIGTVDYVSPSEIKVLLDIEAPQNTALNTGTPNLFPRINGFVLIPNEVGALVGIINWIGIEHSAYPKRRGFQDYDLIDLPFPLRKMSINPIGTLKSNGRLQEDGKEYDLERGIYTFPSLGDAVSLPSDAQMQAIIENKEKNATVIIGKATLAGNMDVKINPDKLFGRHLAILGNTGSGKSCSVAGLIRWSLESAVKSQLEKNRSLPENQRKSNVNARFIILDPNGEYSHAFDGIQKPVRKYRVKLGNENLPDDLNALTIPAWMWNSHEWIGFSLAAPGAQRPLLLQSLADLKRGRQLGDTELSRSMNFLQRTRNLILAFLAELPTTAKFVQFKGMCVVLENIVTDCDFFQQRNESLNSELAKNFGELNVTVKSILDLRKWSNNARTGYNEFSQGNLHTILEKTEAILGAFRNDQVNISKINSDTPLEFTPDDLIPYLEELAQIEGGNVLQFVHMLSLRMKFLLADERMHSVVIPEAEIPLSKWLENYIGNNEAENGQVCVIDLSLIPSDVIHIIVAILSRLVFESLQRYRKSNNEELPTVIVLEEAHTFIRDKNTEDTTNSSQLCKEIFERIAREGRKFGLSLVLSSQRPSELSPTVLSQCNTFLLHRLVNDRDQELVKKLVPDNVGGLLKELPVLPTRKAVLLGWASPIPMLVEMRELEKANRPHSNDPDFWDVWTANKHRHIDWNKIADEWQGKEITSGENNPE